MAIIRDLGESENLEDPFTRNECIKIWNNFYRNTKHLDGKVDYILLDSHIFGSCESFTSSHSGDTSGSDIESFFPCVFSGNMKLMASINSRHKGFDDFDTYYASEKRINSF